MIALANDGGDDDCANCFKRTYSLQLRVEVTLQSPSRLFPGCEEGHGCCLNLKAYAYHDELESLGCFLCHLDLSFKCDLRSWKR